MHFVPIFRHPLNPIPLSRLPPTNYSFKVVFRVFRNFHSVPVKLLLCSDWNIQRNNPSANIKPLSNSPQRDSSPVTPVPADSRLIPQVFPRLADEA